MPRDGVLPRRPAVHGRVLPVRGTTLRRVYLAADLPTCECCGEEPFCPRHGCHFADCECLGPDNAVELGYEVFEEDGKLWARKKKERRA